LLEKKKKKKSDDGEEVNKQVERIPLEIISSEILPTADDHLVEELAHEDEMEQSQTSESSLTESVEDSEDSPEDNEEKVPKISKLVEKKIKKAQKKEQQLFCQIQRSKRKVEELTATGAGNPSSARSEVIQAHFRPYLTKEVVAKFLDILGNKKGQTKKKETGYQRRGWGSIEELTDVLRGAGWLTNQKETAKGVQRTKHGSSTISYRMPLKNNSSDTTDMDAPASLVIQFHNDHMRGALIREITRHFIIRAVEGAGLTESALEKYYTKNFLDRCTEKS